MRAESRPRSRAPGVPRGSRTVPWATIAGILCVMLVIWILISATLIGGAPFALVAMIGMAVAIFATSVRIAGRSRALVPLIVVLACGVFAIAQWDLIRNSGLAAPLGYSNAAGTLYVTAAASGLLLAFNTPNVLVRLAGAVAAILFASVPFLNDTLTAAGLVLLLPPAAYLAWTRRASVLVGIMTVLISLTLSAVAYLGLSYDAAAARTGALQRAVDGSLSERRIELWHDAFALMRTRPVFGVGPMDFPRESPVARRERDTQWPHNEFLHVGAEAGVPALLILLAVLACTFTALAQASDQRAAAIGAFALGAAAIHASVDYVLHFPAVLASVAAVVGASIGTRPRVVQQRGTSGINALRRSSVGSRMEAAPSRSSTLRF